jgi:hypothetical protein
MLMTRFSIADITVRGRGDSVTATSDDVRLVVLDEIKKRPITGVSD